MTALKNSRTGENLKVAFSAEAQANRRYLYFAQKADLEGHSAAAVVFRVVAEGETGHAHGHLDYLKRVGDPVTLCLVSIPRNCPPGDDRGKVYSAANWRTQERWSLPDSQHSCGGA